MEGVEVYEEHSPFVASERSQCSLSPFSNTSMQSFMQVSPSIHNICRIFHLSPTSFDTRCIHILKSAFQKKVKFARETKGGKCSGSFVIFPRNGPSGWRSHFLYCSLSRLAPVIRLCLPCHWLKMRCCQGNQLAVA